MDHIQTVKIHDVEDGEIYTAKIQKNGKRWMGWIQEHPKVKCEADTQDALLETLENTLYQFLEADWQAWDKQLEEDVKAGKLNSTLERVSADFHAGKYEDLAEKIFTDRRVESGTHRFAWCRCRTSDPQQLRPRVHQASGRRPNPSGLEGMPAPFFWAKKV